MLAGADPVMAANGTVTGTANSLSLALAQAHASRFVTAALAAVDAAIAAEQAAASPDATAIAAMEDQKVAIVAAWNDEQAPWLQDMAAAIISHITTYAEVSTVITSAGGGGLQRLPDPPDALAGTLAPSSDVNLEGTIA